MNEKKQSQDRQLSHYFSVEASGISEPRLQNIMLGSEILQYWTDHGVFSRKGLDRGTEILLDTLQKKENQTRLQESFIGKKQVRVLDLGCGWGILGLTWKHWNPNHELWSLDVNERAVELTLRNARQQNLSLHAVQEDAETWLPKQNGFDLILSNPPIRIGKEKLYKLLFQAYECLYPYAWMVLVVGKKQGAASLKKFLESLSNTVLTFGHGQGFWVYAVNKESSETKLD